jgi:hypothetical protein
VREFGKYGVEEDIRCPERDTYEESFQRRSEERRQWIHLLLRIYKAIAALHLAAVVTPKKPNSNAQQRMEKPLTTHGFQLP